MSKLDDRIAELERKLKALRRERMLARRSASMKAAWGKPEVRAKIKSAITSPDVRARNSANVKVALADPSVRQKMSAARKLAYADPAYAEKMGAAVTAGWERRHERELAPKRPRSCGAAPTVRDPIEYAIFGAV